MFFVLFLIGLCILCILGTAITDSTGMLYVEISCIVFLVILMMISPLYYV